MPLLTSEELVLPPQLPASSMALVPVPTNSLNGNPPNGAGFPRSRRLRATFNHSPRSAPIPASAPAVPNYNPFSTAYLDAPPGTLDVMCHVTLDTVPAALDLIKASVMLPFSAVPSRHHPYFVSLVHGIRPPSTPFIFEPHAARVWQEDATWRKEIRGTKPISAPHGPLDAARTARARGHPHWPYFVAATLARMLAVTAGLQQRGHECLRAVIVLQSIREMLRLRSVMRAALRRAARSPPTAVTLPKFGTLAVTPDGYLAFDGSARSDPAFLDMTGWRSEQDVAKGLVAWTNAEFDVAADFCAALQSTRLSIRAAPHWCRLALCTCAARDVDSAIAVVGIVRFLFQRKWTTSPDAANSEMNEPESYSIIPGEHEYERVRNHANAGEHEYSIDGSVVDPFSTVILDQMCANEFLDRAVAVPDVERTLPEMMGVARSFGRGHDIDCGALTIGEILEVTRLNSAPSRRGRRATTTASSSTKSGMCGKASGDDQDRSWSSWSLREVRRRRVVMSVWTDAPVGDEWYVRQGVSTFIDFRMSTGRYRLSVAKGDVRCKRLGTSAPWSRRGRRKSRTDAVDRCEAGGAAALCNALDRAYGDAVCFHVLSWMQRGIVRLHDTCVAAAFVPRHSLGGSLVVNRRLPFQICRRMVFARKGHQLFWLPGEDLPPFRVRDCPNGSYQLTEVKHLPAGIELCRGEIAKDFG